MNRLEYALNLLREGYPFDDKTYYRIIEGNRPGDKKTLPRMIKDAMGEFAEESAPDSVDEDIIIDILYGMNEFVCRYSAIPAFKQRLRDSFCEWIRLIADNNGISDIENLIDEYMENPVGTDTDVTILKALHAMKPEEGKTKDEIAALIHAKDTKNIQVKLRKLDPSLKEQPRTKQAKGEKNKRKQPNTSLRLGDQVLRVGVEYKDIPLPRDDNPNKTAKIVRKYYSRDTLSPIVLQLNVTQVGMLLRGMMMLYNNEVSNNSYEMALNIWSQLSEHVRDRVKEHVYHDNREFIQFLDDLEKDECSNRIFVTEREMSEDETIETKITIIEKMGRTCDVEFGKDHEIMRNCKLRPNFDSDEKPYRLINDSKEVLIDINDIHDIKIVDDYKLNKE